MDASLVCGFFAATIEFPFWTSASVFDATFGQYSLNNNTPKDYYMGVETEYDFPSVDDF